MAVCGEPASSKKDRMLEQLQSSISARCLTVRVCRSMLAIHGLLQFIKVRHDRDREKLCRNVSDSRQMQPGEAVCSTGVKLGLRVFFLLTIIFCVKLLLHLIYSTRKKYQQAISRIQMDQK